MKTTSGCSLRKTSKASFDDSAVDLLLFGAQPDQHLLQRLDDDGRVVHHEVLTNHSMAEDDVSVAGVLALACLELAGEDS